jgi:hypothetical protein
MNGQKQYKVTTPERPSTDSRADQNFPEKSGFIFDGHAARAGGVAFGVAGRRAAICRRRLRRHGTAA